MACKRLTIPEYESLILQYPSAEGLPEDLCNDGCRFNCGNSNSLGDRSCAGDEVCICYCPNNNYRCVPKCQEGYYPFWAGPWGYEVDIACLPLAMEVSNESEPDRPENGIYCLDVEGLGSQSYLGAHAYYTNTSNSSYGIMNWGSGSFGPRGWQGMEQPYGQRGGFGFSEVGIDSLPDFSSTGFTVSAYTAGCSRSLVCSREFYPDNYESPCPSGYEGGGGWCYQAPFAVQSCEDCGGGGYDPVLGGYVSSNCYDGSPVPN